MSPRLAFAGALVLALGASACSSVSTLQTAHSLGKGKTQLALETGEQALVTRDTLRAYPVSGIAVRHGVSERVDLGARLGPSGLEAMVKVQLTRPPPDVVVSLAPQLAAYAWNTSDVAIRAYNAALPVLVGIPLPHEHQLVLAPRVHLASFSLGAGSAHGFLDTLAVGGTVGIAWKMPSSKAIRIVTELGVMRPVLLWADRSDGVGGLATLPERWTLQANLGFLLGDRS